MGTPDYATCILESLLEKHEIVALITQEDKKAGRDMKLKMPSTKALILSKNLDIPIFQPKILDETFVNELKKIPCDVIIVAAFGKILPKSILEMAPCVNLHASLLPKYRGASPIQESILQGDKFFGVTLMQMEEGLDSGDILAFCVIKNSHQDSFMLFDELSKMAAKLTLDYLEKFFKMQSYSQIACDKSVVRKIKKEFGLVDFSDAKILERKALAYASWPEIFLEKGLKLRGVFEEKSRQGQGFKKGEILEIEKDSVLVGCKKGAVWIKELQAPSKKALCSFQYLQGKRLQVGDILE